LLSVTWTAGVNGAVKDGAAAPAGGTFTLLTYNVAGLPIFVSQSDPMHNMPQIGSLLNLYDVAVVQEDFAYHEALNAGAKHGFRSPPLLPDAKVGIGDGLNVFSRLPLSHVERVTWRACSGRFSNGSDCLAPKGFAFADLELATGVEVDLYDLHMDSSNAPDDIAARAEQAEQLAAFLEHRSAHHAVIVAGDTNMGAESEQILQRFLKRTGLTDACRTLSCSHPRLIDRVMYRSSTVVELRAEDFVVDSRFVREDGKDLSDHEAIGVAMQWRRENRVARR
jgi:endonuclease/exonuclease/phosphatase family metal-dependent hydrolase